MKRTRKSSDAGEKVSRDAGEKVSRDAGGKGEP